MTKRAFLIGLLLVAIVAALTPFNDYLFENTYFTGNHFPPGPFFLLLLLTLVVNILIKFVHPRAAFRQAELMLIWCMLLVSSTVPASGLMRYWLPTMAAPAYYANSPDLPSQDIVLEATPEALVVSKNPHSIAAKQFFEGGRKGEKTRIYLGRWARPIAVWLIFIGFYYLATFFVGGMLRKQWVEVERLMFPLARVPLELTEGSGRKRLLPEMFHQAPFLVGFALTLAFALIRVSPVFLGKEQGWLPEIPLQNILANTPLDAVAWVSVTLYPLAVGIAFLVPADVTLSVWLFFWVIHSEILVSTWIGKPLKGGFFGEFMRWQQAGAFFSFVPMFLWAARRHLATVIKKAFGRGRDIDDSAEPIPYALSFWGLLFALAGMVGWLCFWKMKLLTAVALVAMLMCALLVHARIVSQGGIFFTIHHFSIPSLLHSMSGGKAFGPTAAIVAHMEDAFITQDTREILSPHAMNALRISSVFEKRRRLFLPVMLVSLALAIGVSAFSSLKMYNRVGGLNIPDAWGTIGVPMDIFRSTAAMINDPTGSAEPHWAPFALGAGVMMLLTFMRTRFFWWPIHSLGFLTASTYSILMLWFSFLLGWGIKVLVIKMGGGAALRKARQFFMGVIIGEAIAIGVTTLLGLTTGFKVGYIFLPG